MELEDPYEIRLFQMFKSCDTNGCGYLNESSLRQLCSLLELQDKDEVVIKDLLAAAGTTGVRITYELFKSALLNFLGEGNDATTTNTTAEATITTTTKSSLHSVGPNGREIVNEGIPQRSLVISDELKKPYMESPPETSDREVLPKFVVGSKKYGRRSRPQRPFNDELSPSDSDEVGNVENGADGSGSKTVERSSSHTDIQSNRRRRTLEHNGSRLKRCASLPAQRKSKLQTQTPGSKTKKSSKQKPASLADEKPLSSSVESLGHEALTSTIREVWSNYSTEVGSSYLSCSQLQFVCQRLGLQRNLAERVALESFGQLHSCPYKQLISVEDFIKLLTGITSIKEQAAIIPHEVFSYDDVLPKDASAHMETLPLQCIIDTWERAGISNGKNILLALGFDDSEVRLAQLYKVIEEEIRGLEDEQQTTLLRASLALQTAELSSVRQVLRQVHEENAKLQADNKEANKRVAMMAIEIDERHATLEENAKKEVQTLEQRHNAAMRDLNVRMANDREHWNGLIAKLESRIKKFEQDEIRLKTELELVRKENEELEGEQQSLQKQITDVLEENIKLNREIADLTDSAQCNESSLERHLKSDGPASDSVTTEDELLQLVEKLASLQVENHRLRDKNDELVVEVENLNLDLQRFRAEQKKRSSSSSGGIPTQPEIETSLEEVDNGSISLATKRRGDSPSKAHITEESPRTGKLRKCVNEKDAKSEEWMALNAELQQEQQEYQIEKTSSSMPPDVVCTLRRRVDELEKLLNEKNSGEIASTTCNEKCEHAKLIERVKELEASLEQMRAAYEDCEDYWQSKLEEERNLFEKQRHIYEDDQQENDRKFTELMEKVREYEEQFNKDGRLSPIEEKDILEQQYVELEAELKSERERSESEIEEKTKEINALQSEIKTLHTEIENLHVRLGEIVSDACNFTRTAAAIAASQQNSHGSSASSPISYLWHQSTIQQPAKLLENPTVDVESSGGAQNQQINRTNLSTTELSTFSTPLTSTSSPQRSSISPIQKPVPKFSQSETDENGADADCDTTSGKSVSTQSERKQERIAKSENNAPSGDEKSCVTPTHILEDIKRLKCLEDSLRDQINDLSFQRDGLVMELQQLHEARPVLEKAYARTAHPNLNQKISQLELKNRHLQNVIKQQHQYSESMMQQSWRQYQTEMNELHSRLDAQVAMITEQSQRLQNADLLVKDLYVENAHLTATVQRLEQQRFRVSMMHQQQQQQHMNQLQGLNIIPGMP